MTLGRLLEGVLSVGKRLGVSLTNLGPITDEKEYFTIIRLLCEKHALKTNNSLITLNFRAIDKVHACEGAAL